MSKKFKKSMGEAEITNPLFKHARMQQREKALLIDTIVSKYLDFTDQDWDVFKKPAKRVFK